MGLVAISAMGQEPRVYSPVPDAYFTRVEGMATDPPTHPTPIVGLSTPWDMEAAGAWLARELASQRPTPTPTPSAMPRPTPRTVPTPAPRPTSSKTSHKVTGTATWYCLPGVSRCPRNRSGGLYAAISPDLGSLRGKHVTVCYRSSCVVVKIIDCNCQATKSIDLFADAFVKLAPLSAGRLRGVTISW